MSTNQSSTAEPTPDQHKTLADEGHRCGVDMPLEEGVPSIDPLTDGQKDIIKATAPVLAEHGYTITRHFYKNMLLAHPELKDVFSESSQKLGQQARVLAEAVHAYAVNIHDLTPLLPVVQRIAYKHASLHIIPEHYSMVGRHLLQAIVDILGDAATPDIKDAWYHGYWNLAHIFINTEQGIYEEAVKKGGWEGWREFVIMKKVKESDEVISLYMEPKEKLDLPDFRPGQYIAVSLDIPALGYKQARQYSLSDIANGKQFRISVRREDFDKQHLGRVSNALHDIAEGSSVNIAYPGGDFHLDEADDGSAPLVLLSAGIGQTPLYSMLRAQLYTKRPISYVTVAKNNTTQAFKKDVETLAKENSNLTFKVFHSRPLPDETSGKDYDHEGRLSVEKVKGEIYIDNVAAHYYLCGPGKFMIETRAALKDLGVEDKRIHFELFSAGDPQ